VSTRLQNATGIYLTGIRDGDPRSAMANYTGARYTQHSAGVPDGKDGFVAFFDAFLARNPRREIRVLRAVEDNGQVFLHVFQSLNDGAAEWVTMDMFNTDDAGRVIEHWDVISAYGPTASGENMLTGPDEPVELERGADNKATVREFVKQVRQAGNLDRLDNFVAEDLIQHHPEIAAGRDGLRVHLADGGDGAYEMLFRVIGQGNFAVAYGKRHRDGADFADFDLYRLENGRIAEQWTCSEQILPRADWGNSGKF